MSDLSQVAKSIALETLAALDVESAVRQALKREEDRLFAGDRSYDLGPGDVTVIGLGKASLRMGQAVEAILGDRMKAGLLVTDYRHKIDVRSEVIVAGHPVPNENSLLAGGRMLEVAVKSRDSRLIIFLISGGGSALVEAPISASMSLADLSELNRILVGSGASIREVNVVRKHLSAIKGGRLGNLVLGVDCLSLYISDVNEGDLRSIASNPLLPDSATLEEFYRIIERYDLTRSLPPVIADLVTERLIERLPSQTTSRVVAPTVGEVEGAAERWERGSSSGGNAVTDQIAPDSESPLADWFECGNIRAKLLMDNRSALRAAERAAALAGFSTVILWDLVEGAYRAVADSMIDRLIELRRNGWAGPLCLISGGEVACEVHGSGTGGRNQEFVLYSAAKLASRLPGQRACILSCGTDGIDGNSPAAGAVADHEVMDEAMRAGLNAWDFIERNDSFTFFKTCGGLIVTGPTGNNVRDIRLLLSY